MQNYMKEITPEMTAIVNKLKQTNFKDATPEEIEIYAQWSMLTSLHKQELDTLDEERKQRIKQNMEQSKKESEAAIKALKALADLAEAKLKAVNDGQEK